MTAPDLAALVPELFDRLAGMAVAPQVLLRRTPHPDGFVYDAVCSNGIHQSTESAAHALESLCDSFRPRLEDLESTQHRVCQWSAEPQSDAALAEARQLLASIRNVVTNKLGLQELQAHDAFVSAFLEEVEKSEPADRAPLVRKALELVLTGQAPPTVSAAGLVAEARIE